MMNLIWMLLMAIGIVYAACTGSIAAISPAIVSAGEQTVTLSLTLLAVLGFWLGLARVAEKSGLLHGLALLLAPILRPLFPSLTKNPQAMQNIVLNFSANLLGLGNAATPFGLKAMQAMQKKNPDPETATDGMCTLLVLNTAGLALLPTTVIALRAANQSADPMATVGVTFVAGLCATAAGLLVDRLLRGRKQGRGR
ncbi:MAG: nucleoside recognition domain-containing protein [Bacillota bacterium]|jgi:spore maturation protein A